MTQSRPKVYTDEVMAAMRAQGLMAAPPAPEAVPAGQVRYHVAIENVASTTGQAAPAAVAASLRALADQLDPPRKVL